MKLKLNQTAGFTLIELLMIIAIMGIIGLMASMNAVRSAAGYQLQTATENLVQALREARTEAVARNTSVDLLLNTNGQNCLIRQIHPTTNAVVATLSRNPINLADPVAEINLTLTNINTNNGTRVLFDHRGRISNLTAASATITVSSGHIDQASTVTLWPETGFISQ